MLVIVIEFLRSARTGCDLKKEEEEAEEEEKTTRRMR